MAQEPSKGGILGKLEKTLGLPPLNRALDFLDGKKTRKLNTLISGLQKLAELGAADDAIRLLELVERLDDKGTLDKLILLIKELKPMITKAAKSPLLQELLKPENLDKAERAVGKLTED